MVACVGTQNTLHVSLYSCIYALLILIMSQLNQLYCSRCHCPWSIFQFPLKDGWWTVTCASCLEQQALCYAGQKQREGEGEEEGEAQAEGEGEQAIGKPTDLFIGRLTLSRATNPLFKLFTGL
jgi:hypothetical protein